LGRSPTATPPSGAEAPSSAAPAEPAPPRTEPGTHAPVTDPQPVKEPEPVKEAARTAIRRKPVVPAATGWITVGLVSGWAKISVGGRSLGPTPIFRHELPAGKHTLVATRPDGQRKTQVVIIEANKERKLSLDW
jgi:hypothetical protein